MATFDTNNPANFEEFSRYYHGELSAGEQNGFEKKLLADPAFADAYEGFVLMQEKGLNAAEISEELAAQLHKRTGEKPAKRIAFQIFAAVATVVIVLGVAWLTVFRNEDEQVSQEVSIQIPETKVAPKNEGGIQPKYETKTEPESQPAGAPVSPEIKIKSLPRTAYSSPERNTRPAVVPAEEQPAANLLDADAAEERIATGEPVPSAFPAAPQPLQAEREQLSRTRIASNNSVSYAMRSSLDEKGSQIPRTNSFGFARQAVAPDSIRNFKIARPEGGWLAYQRYLDKNVLTSKDSTTVHVEFVVKPDRSLSDFKVSGPAEIRDRAIQIIHQGPSWIPAADQGAPTDVPVRVSLQVRPTE